MKRIDGSLDIYASGNARNYLQVLKDNKTFDRMVDAYLFAAAYAMKQDLAISDVILSDRGNLISFGQIDNNVRLALESGIHIQCKKNYLPEPTNGKEALEILCKYAEVGLQELKERWRGKTSNQIQVDIQRMIDA